jgi:hypothetical protein
VSGYLLEDLPNPPAQYLTTDITNSVFGYQNAYISNYLTINFNLVSDTTSVSLGRLNFCGAYKYRIEASPKPLPEAISDWLTDDGLITATNRYSPQLLLKSLLVSEIGVYTITLKIELLNSVT